MINVLAVIAKLYNYKFTISIYAFLIHFSAAFDPLEIFLLERHIKSGENLPIEVQ